MTLLGVRVLFVLDDRVVWVSCYSLVLIVFTQFIQLFIFTASMAIGINEWFAPQISEHCP